jgi:hypothetical protein
MGTGNTAPQRDLRIDFFRGLALLFIFIDHVPDNVLANFTLRNFGFADAAEVFVLLAGFSAMLAYGRTFEAEGFRAGALRVLGRARDVYTWHLGLLLICGFGLTAAAHLFANPEFVDGLGLRLFTDDPQRALVLAATLVNQPNLLNILPLYVVLLLLWVPLLLWLIVRRPGIALLLSVAVWGVANLLGLNLPSHHHPEGWVFNPFAWQLLVTIGALAARASLRAPIRFSSSLAVIAAAYATFGLFFAAPWTLISGLESYRVIPQEALGTIDKIYLSPWRVAHILALGYLSLTLLSPQGRWLAQPWAMGVGYCGRHSLQIFCLATLLAMTSWVFLAEAGYGFVQQALVNVLGVSALLATAWALELRKRGATQLPLAQSIRRRVSEVTSPPANRGPSITTAAD